jgi:ribosomal protein L44E
MKRKGWKEKEERGKRKEERRHQGTGGNINRIDRIVEPSKSIPLYFTCDSNCSHTARKRYVDEPNSLIHSMATIEKARRCGWMVDGAR